MQPYLGLQATATPQKINNRTFRSDFVVVYAKITDWLMTLFL